MHLLSMLLSHLNSVSTVSSEDRSLNFDLSHYQHFYFVFLVRFNRVKKC